MTKQIKYSIVLVSLATAILLLSSGVGAASRDTPASPLSQWYGFGHDRVQDELLFEDRKSVV